MVVLTCIECLTKLQRSYQEMVAFFFSLSQLGNFSNLIRWNLSVGLRGLEQCRFNVVITFLMLKQRCGKLTIVNCGKWIVTFL